MVIYPPLNLLETAILGAISNGPETIQAFSRGYYDDDAYLRGEEEGIPDIAYLLLWVGLCAALSSLYRITDRIKKEDEETSKKIFSSVVVASGAGGMIGFFIILAVVISVMVIDAIFGLSISSFVTQKTNLIVLFFAAVNVAGLNYLLRNTDDVVVRSKHV